jgi:mRNA interferase MazF
MDRPRQRPGHAGRKVRRGDIWIGAERLDYLGKPHPVVIIQADEFAATGSVVVCGLTSEAPPPGSLLRVPVEADRATGLRETSFIMCDKPTTVRRDRLQTCIGRASERTMTKVDVALLVFLGLTR